MNSTITNVTPRSAIDSSDVPIIHTLYQLYQTWHKLMLTFPKSQRYTLGATCQNHLLIALEATLAAANSPRPEVKQRQLQMVSAKIDVLKLLVRLAKDCQCITTAQYGELQTMLHEAGRMLGGWLKAVSK